MIRAPQVIPAYVLSTGVAVQARAARGWQTVVTTRDHPARAERVYLNMRADRRKPVRLVRA